MADNFDDSWCCSLSGKEVGAYVLLNFVGKGKIGYVYRAELKGFKGTERAVKLTFDTLKSGWQNEVKKVMQLQLVDGVVHYHDLGNGDITHNNQSRLFQYTIWDYIPPGENLKNYLERIGEIEPSFLLAVIERVLRVLHGCHEKGVPRHGDLHSGNILIGDPSIANLDDSLQKRWPIYVSDFGYGVSGTGKQPKDDYEGLANIINEMVKRINFAKTTGTDKQILNAIKSDIGKFLKEPSLSERRSPLELLHLLTDIKKNAQAKIDVSQKKGSTTTVDLSSMPPNQPRSVGQFQVSEMIGDNWDWWKELFVPAVPARSKILALDIPTVVTGPRGCGKTMLFRRLSERLIVECGEVAEFSEHTQFTALYVNANDFADAFSNFPEEPTEYDARKLVSYANLCVLSDLLGVQSARAGRLGELASDELINLIKNWLVPSDYFTVLEGEDRLERCRTILEQIKWKFVGEDVENIFPGYDEFSQHRWLPQFIQQARTCCSWMEHRAVFLFIDDFSMPRISASMQRILNRLYFQRSPNFLAKISTEASSTFISEDSSGKNLQDGDDFQLVDMGEESLFLSDEERQTFLFEIFSRRLKLDSRIADENFSLVDLLGTMPLSKTEFARRLRGTAKSQPVENLPNIESDSQRRGPTRANVEYFGANVFADLWSGDTRTMIQLITDVVDLASEMPSSSRRDKHISLPVKRNIQDQVFRNRGGEWLDSHTRNAPTDPIRTTEEIAIIQKEQPEFKLSGEYGSHLKAVVEAFVSAARALLFSPPYIMRQGNTQREVPRMAFRIEIMDEFRIDGLAKEIYRDLIRYGLFMRDSRGKSVRGTFVPRLYLRRLLLPYCALALSKRDSVLLSCEDFIQLLLYPDNFKKEFAARRTSNDASSDQLSLSFLDSPKRETPDPIYDDINLNDSENSRPNGDNDQNGNNEDNVTDQ